MIEWSMVDSVNGPSKGHLVSCHLKGHSVSCHWGGNSPKVGDLLVIFLWVPIPKGYSVSCHPYGHSVSCHFDELPLRWVAAPPIIPLLEERVYLCSKQEVVVFTLYIWEGTLMGYGKIKAYLRKVLFSIRKDLLPKIRQSLFCKNKKKHYYSRYIYQNVFHYNL